ncbi:S-adenosyl-L-methionine-dependent methyltransferase [Coniophora puteana RWD-64-598 SS2]|uniref:S-adenosyl-L-methionine-dependent methyltransferase n=1 Tax=Coniophora puteana (strain RWD-64-598) TaxID=741705 RepID=A0A5M3N4Y5_CONPW|nr:S-adenosyl-L-methionine-dependent methyltransferase [Coniophora puteana RWD-64-598 SS2]EIW86482.1 S-adenosyl-L-methionine-dependent methyltransferase [Coniophora puteana RWD-64-598 SS2]
MIPTPDLSHLTKVDYDRVYEPAEDTFLFLDGLEQDAEHIRSLHPTVCLEIGSGSGCVSTFMGSILGPTGALYLCTDINQHAARCTVATGRQNKIPIDAINCSLTSSLLPRLRHSIDILLFNPPYVPTDGEEALDAQASGNISGAWAGGLSGMEITNKLLEEVNDLLSPKGLFYLVALKQNDIPAICAMMQDAFGLKSQTIIQRRAGREHLFILRFERQYVG